jgi:uncharacterized protein (UPF0147 family)
MVNFANLPNLRFWYVLVLRSERGTLRSLIYEFTVLRGFSQDPWNLPFYGLTMFYRFTARLGKIDVP